ncbi:MAG: hypothetical protein HGB11_07910 [Chlorobiales bacterium]|nr:hypothetical protein [Chlorobiales bacterium]
MLDVKQAIAAARKAASEFFEDASLIDLQLEEVEFDTARNVWLITLGFNVPNRNLMKGIGAVIGNERQYIRKYKLFMIDALTGQVKSMKIREV